MSAADPPRQVLTDGWFAATGAALEPLGAGHIHDTWLVRAPAGRVVLQRVNERVFTRPRELMQTLAAVVAHLNTHAPGFVPELRPTRHGQAYFEYRDGSVWRLWEFVADTRTLEQLGNLAQARAAGRAFARVQRYLADLPIAVPDPIVGFMQLSHYLAQLDDAADGAAASAAVDQALAFVAPRRELAAAFAERDRLIHGDGKVNNLLYHADADEVVCVLDLDTVMRGHWAWDFGDLARSAATRADGFSVALYGAVAEGFVRASGVAADVDALVLAPRYVSLMLGVRFLTDHLYGDRYFKVASPGQNLQRALAQFELCAAMEAREAAMRRAARRA